MSSNQYTEGIYLEDGTLKKFKDAELTTVVNQHTSNTSNPHSVTKSQVGLSNVPNVATNDQTPTYSAASTLVTLTSGEKLSVSMGKIMKAITDLISHIGDTIKHITSTERTNWNAAKTHADSAHAPSSAQENVIETVEVNGTALTPTSKTVNITVPTNNNQLQNGAGYIKSADISGINTKISTLNSRVARMGHYAHISLSIVEIASGNTYKTVQPSAAGSTAFFEWFTTGGINLKYAGYYLVTIYVNISNTTTPYNSVTGFLQYHDNTTSEYTTQNNGLFCGGITATYSTSTSAKGAGVMTRMVYATTNDYRILLQLRNNHSATSGKNVITVEDTSYINIMYLGHENL